MTEETYRLLERLEKRTGMYTGENSLKSISAFLSGYDLAVRDNSLTDDINISIDFFDWVANKLGYYESTAGWANMILANVIGLDPKNIKWEEFDKEVTEEQHNKSIRKFYELLKEYRESLDK